MTRRTFDLEEFEELPFSGDPGGLTESDWKQLQSRWRTTTSKKLSACFEFTGTAVKPKNWVGTIVGDQFTLQVIPRGAKYLSPNDRGVLGRNIDQMLRLAISGRSIELGDAELQGDGSRLDSAVDALCDLVLLARRRRILRLYVARTEHVASLLGRVLFPGQAINEVRRPGSFLSHWVEPSQNTPENIFLKWALNVLRSSVGGRVRRRLDGCLCEFEAVNEADGPTHYKRIRFDRVPLDYQSAIQIAKGLVEGELPGLFAGSHRARSELVFMPDVFELFIRRLAIEAGSSRRWSVPEKTGRVLGRWATGPRINNGAFNLIPDVEIWRSGYVQPLLLLDVKWKWLKPGLAGFGIDEDDIYQLMTYLHRHECARGLLVYPWLSRGPALGSPLVRLTTFGTPNASITVASISLLWEKLRLASDQLGSAIEEALA